MNQASFMRMFRDMSRKGECECGSPPSCDTLECLCRPRFFAGQLLTDDDLKRLDYYIVAKNRLHNRHLHGAGVVCGLEVVCNPCDTGVTVREGYALGPCGEDIVVCDDVKVPIADLIREFRGQSVKDSPCGNRYESGSDNCESIEQDWILSICYEEHASRGMMSLKSPKKDCGCGCGGHGSTNGKSGGCGCGGGSKSSSSTAVKTKSCSCSQVRTSSPQCEPTLTCESYRFMVTKAPKTNLDREDSALNELTSRSLLVQRVMKCLLSMVGTVTQFPSQPNANNLRDFCCTLKHDLIDIVRSGNVHNCRLIEDLNEIVCPSVDDEEFLSKMMAAFQSLYQVAIGLFKDCVCSALLPPCAVGGIDSCVPLATLTVRTSNLQVLSICNWSSRKFAVTIPMLGYWLDWLPIFDSLRDAMTHLCCTKSSPKYSFTPKMEVRTVQAQPGFTEMSEIEGGRTSGTANAVKTESTRKSTGAAEVALQYAKATSPLSGLDATILAALGLKGEGGVNLATDLELMNPFSALAFTQLASPALGSMVPNDLYDRLVDIRGKQKISVKSVDDVRLSKMEEELAAMKKTISAQNAAIKKLSKPGASNA